ncbi:MAG: hypothetical protein PHU49_04585 [Syntrophorhabdaceae bacterium]|nr:hypothetical protein [Syntrophorhabdaceae bacterium]MDD5243273.1 hypothetical protein [Syntrophorhabdaceae bacterium]
MDRGNFIVRCSRCGAKNRIPGDRPGNGAVCGKCRTNLDLSLLYPDRPLNASDTTFHNEVVTFNGPVLVEFTAPW